MITKTYDPEQWQLVPKVMTGGMLFRFGETTKPYGERWRNTLAIAPQHESQWQPIETAPKDCNIILFGRWWSDEQGWMKEPVIGRWNQKTDGRWEFANAGGWWGIRPTVWTPLPQHPEPSEPLNCPDCSNQGWYAVGCAGDFEQVQCRFCYTEPNSVFNRTQQAAPQHESQWQPIETAPKDCNIILFGRWWSDEQGWMKEPVIGRWNQKTDGRWEFANAGGWWGIRPTVWTPLPQHPDTIKVPRPEGHDSWSIEINSTCGGGGKD